MRLKNYINESKAAFLGSCDRIRRKPGGEDLWQCMMASKKKISEKELIKNVNLKQLLDPGETWEQWKETAPDAEFFKSDNNTYFIQTAGFEYIFKK